MFKQRRIEYAPSVEFINKVLEESKKRSFIIYEDYSKKKANESLTTCSFIKDSKVNFEVTTSCYDGKPCTYTFRKDGETKQSIAAVECYKEMQRVYKLKDFSKEYPEKVDDMGKFIQSAGALIGYTSSGEDYLYVYDLNSAYANILLNFIPDTYSLRLNDVVGENEIGFEDDATFSLVHEGKFAPYVCPLIPSPYKEWVKRIYEKKKNAPKGSTERQRYKDTLNFAVGMLQRHNPFVRAYIVNSCNEFIESKIDENSVMWNTDAIYSKTPRPDLEIGDEIGLFKIEYEGLIRHEGTSYQYVETGETHKRSVPQKWFKKDFNLLTDDDPTYGNVYYFNKDSFRIEETKYEI